MSELVVTLIQRILRTHAEEDEIKSGRKEIYGEAASHGVDKTALGLAVRTIRQREKSETPAAAERQTIADLYIEAFDASHVRACAREGRNEIASNLLQKAAQSEGATGESPEQGSGVRAGLDGGMGTSAQPDQFVTQSGEGEDAVAPSVDPSPAADDTIRMPSGAEAGSAVRTGAPIIAKPYDPGPIPAFLDRRVRA